MKVITEAKVRAEVPRSEHPEAYYIEPGYILSPAAREYLMGRQIKIVNGPKAGQEPEPESVVIAAEVPPMPSANPQSKVESAKYVDYATGACYFEKPVHMTILCGNVLVPKDHPQIAFRGKLESLQAQIILSQAMIAGHNGNQKLIDDLNDILIYLRNILRKHILTEPLEPAKMLGLTASELRERAKNPMQYFNVEQVGIPDYTRGLEYAQLNQLYTQTREAEVAAVAAFREGNRYTRNDILETLNDMSSAFRVMMFMHLAGEYK